MGKDADSPAKRPPEVPEPDEHEPADDDLMRQLHARQPTIVEEFWHFLRHNKKWWLLPILVALLFLGTLVVLSGTALAPFMYPF